MKRHNLWIGLALVAIVVVAVVVAIWVLSPPLFCIPGPLGDYKAEDTKSYSGTVAVDNVYLEVDNFNGFINVSTWGNAEYRINVTIEAKGTTQENAEDNLNDLEVNFDESVVQGQKRLVLNYDVPFCTHSRYSTEVKVVLPTDAMIDLDLDSSNGGIYLAEIEGETLKMETSNGLIVLNNVHAESITGTTSNGAIYLTNVEGDTLRMITSNGRLVFSDVLAERLTGTTSNARVEGNVEATDTFLTTSNGKINLTILCTVNGEYDLTTSNGDMNLMVSSSTEVGYDLDLSTSNGDIDINLSGLNYSLDQKTHKKAQSEGFDGKAVQIVIEASTSNGNIDVDTS